MNRSRDSYCVATKTTMEVYCGSGRYEVMTAVAYADTDHGQRYFCLRDCCDDIAPVANVRLVQSSRLIMAVSPAEIVYVLLALPTGATIILTFSSSARVTLRSNELPNA
jgi:hypothetical protein